MVNLMVFFAWHVLWPAGTDAHPELGRQPPGPPQLSASPALDHFQTAQSPPGPYDDTLPVDNSH
jgi:hypothetical protein